MDGDDDMKGAGVAMAESSTTDCFGQPVCKKHKGVIELWTTRR